MGLDDSFQKDASSQNTNILGEINKFLTMNTSLKLTTLINWKGLHKELCEAGF